MSINIQWFRFKKIINVNVMDEQKVEETNIPSVNLNPSKQSGEVKQNSTPLDQSIQVKQNSTPLDQSSKT